MPITFVFGVLSLLMLGCGTPDFEVEKPEDFWTPEVKSEMADRIRRGFQERDQKYIIHIHFNGHDWGAYKDLETKVDFHNPGRAFPFARHELPNEAGALNIVTEFEDQSILLSLIYRFKSASKAVYAFENLFQCEDGSSRLLQETLILGSGASHGAHELAVFGKKLKQRCGKAIDFAMISDAIAQPGPFPLHSFDGLEPGGYCVQFYQRAWDQLIRGDAVENCTNVKVRDAYHFGKGGMTRYPEAWMHTLLNSLNLRKPDYDLSLLFERIPFLREEFL